LLEAEIIYHKEWLKDSGGGDESQAEFGVDKYAGMAL
jgi:hypothetical protein